VTGGCKKLAPQSVEKAEVNEKPSVLRKVGKKPEDAPSVSPGNDAETKPRSTKCIKATSSFRNTQEKDQEDPANNPPSVKKMWKNPPVVATSSPFLDKNLANDEDTKPTSVQSWKKPASSSLASSSIKVRTSAFRNNQEKDPEDHANKPPSVRKIWKKPVVATSSPFLDQNLANDEGAKPSSVPSWKKLSSSSVASSLSIKATSSFRNNHEKDLEDPASKPPASVKSLWKKPVVAPSASLLEKNLADGEETKPIPVRSWQKPASSSSVGLSLLNKSTTEQDETTKLTSTVKKVLKKSTTSTPFPFLKKTDKDDEENHPPSSFRKKLVSPIAKSGSFQDTTPADETIVKPSSSKKVRKKPAEYVQPSPASPVKSKTNNTNDGTGTTATIKSPVKQKKNPVLVGSQSSTRSRSSATADPREETKKKVVLKRVVKKKPIVVGESHDADNPEPGEKKKEVEVNKPVKTKQQANDEMISKSDDDPEPSSAEKKEKLVKKNVVKKLTVADGENSGDNNPKLTNSTLLE
jgi:hypothetical protein